MTEIPKVEQCSTACFVDKLVPESQDVMSAADFIANLVVDKGDVPAENVVSLVQTVNRIDCSTQHGACPRFGTVDSVLRRMGGHVLLEEFLGEARNRSPELGSDIA